MVTSPDSPVSVAPLPGDHAVCQWIWQQTCAHWKQTFARLTPADIRQTHVEAPVVHLACDVERCCEQAVVLVYMQPLRVAEWNEMTEATLSAFHAPKTIIPQSSTHTASQSLSEITHIALETHACPECGQEFPDVSHMQKHLAPSLRLTKFPCSRNHSRSHSRQGTGRATATKRGHTSVALIVDQDVEAKQRPESGQHVAQSDNRHVHVHDG